MRSHRLDGISRSSRRITVESNGWMVNPDFYLLIYIRVSFFASKLMLTLTYDFSRFLNCNSYKFNKREISVLDNTGSMLIAMFFFLIRSRSVFLCCYDGNWTEKLVKGFKRDQCILTKNELLTEGHWSSSESDFSLFYSSFTKILFSHWLRINLSVYITSEIEYQSGVVTRSIITSLINKGITELCSCE